MTGGWSRAASACAVAFAAVVSPIAAQETVPHEVELSSVVTLPVAIPARMFEQAVAGEAVSFEVLAGPGFQVAGTVAGRLDLRADDLPYLPVTIAVGPALPAGRRPALTTLFRSGTDADTARADVVVRPRTGFRLSLGTTGRATPGSRLSVTWEATNRGNVADTIALKLDTRLGDGRALPGPVVLSPFATVRGQLEIDVSPAALPMPTLVVVKAHGVHDTTFATLEVPVQDREGVFGSLVRVPTRLFLGSSVESGGSAAPAFGIQAEGLLRTGVRLRVEAHGRGRDVSSFAFRGLNIGPSFHAQLDSRPVSAAVGDVVSRTAAFAGYNLQGRGGRVDAGSDDLRLHAHAARPIGAGGSTVGGHQLAGGLDLVVAPVRVGGRIVSEDRREDPTARDQSLRTAYVRLESALPSRHAFDVEAGWARIEDLENGRVAEGPALWGRYGYRDAENLVDLTVRRQPMLDGVRAAGQDETRLSVVSEAPGDFGVAGQVYRIDGPRTSLVGVGRIDGAEGGVFMPYGNSRYELRGRIRRLYREERIEEHTIEGRIDAGLGPGSIDARLEVGRTFGDDVDRDGIVRTDAGYNLRNGRGWARIGASFYQDAFSAGNLSLDVSGAYRLARQVELYGSYGGPADRLSPDDVALAQIGVQVDVRSDLSVLAGLEKSRGASGQGLRFSLGVRKGLPLPVPFPQEKSVQGTVFEDLDGDGQRGPAEPFLDGVRLTMGAYAVSTRRGYFVFPSGAPRELIQVELASLGAGFLPPQPVPTPDGDRIDIPVHRAASLRIGAFFDRDGDGVRGPTEMPMADVELEIARSDEPGWTLRTGADGAVELSAVRPGGYVVGVGSASLPRRAMVPELASITLRAGEAGVVELAIPARPVVLLEVPAGEPTDGEDAEGGRK